MEAVGCKYCQCFGFEEKNDINATIDFEAETQKCKESPFYFYDKYVNVKGVKKMNEEEFNNQLGLLEKIAGRKLL